MLPARGLALARVLRGATAPAARAALAAPRTATARPAVAWFGSTGAKRHGDGCGHGHGHGHEHERKQLSPEEEAKAQKEAEFIARLQNMSVEAKELMDRSEFTKALSNAEHMCTLTEEYFGKAHPAYASALNNVGFVWRRLGDIDRAALYYDEAYAIYLKVLGPEHRSTMTAAFNLGTALTSQPENYTRAINLLKDLIDVTGKYMESVDEEDRKFYGETYLHANKQIMSMYINMKEMEEAEFYSWHCLKRVLEVFDENHLYSATAFNNMGFVHYKTNNLDSAKPLLLKAKEIRKLHLKPNHPNVRSVEDLLRRVHKKEVRISEGKEPGDEDEISFSV